MQSSDDSLTFRDFDGQVKWAIDPGVVSSYELTDLGEGPPWIVVFTNAGEEIVVDPLSGEIVPDMNTESLYYGDWAVQVEDYFGRGGSYLVTKRNAGS